MTISVNGGLYGGISRLQHHDSPERRPPAETVNSRKAPEHLIGEVDDSPINSGMVGHSGGTQRTFGSTTGANPSPLVSGGGSQEAVAAVLEFDTIRHYVWITAETRSALRGACRELQKAEFCLTTLSQFKPQQYADKVIPESAYAARVNSDLRALLIDNSRFARLMFDDARAAPLAGELRMHAAKDECRRSLDCLRTGINSLVVRAVDLGIALDPECKQMLAHSPWLLSEHGRVDRK